MRHKNLAKRGSLIEEEKELNEQMVCCGFFFTKKKCYKFINGRVFVYKRLRMGVFVCVSECVGECICV